MAYEKYTIRQYMNAKWGGDTSVISFEELQVVETEYVDTAELYEKDEFVRQQKIEYYTHRINTITLHIKLQKEFLKEFGICFKETLPKFKEYGYSVEWRDKDHFLKMMRKITRSEKIYMSQLEDEIKQLIDIRSKRERKEQTVSQSRGSFIKTIATLNKEGYGIVYDVTRMEELAHAIKMQYDIVKDK